MTRTNRSRHAVLALLSFGPKSGYDIERDIKRAIGHFWKESFGQIYPALRGFVEEGLATVHEEPQAGKPNRKVYTITEAGRESLGSWLQTPPEPPPVRNEMLLKLFVGWQTSPETLETHISALLEHFTRELKGFELYEQVLGRQAEENPDAIFWLMTLRSGQLYMEARRQWCEEALVMLDRIGSARRSSPASVGERTAEMARLLAQAHETLKALENPASEKEEVAS